LTLNERVLFLGKFGAIDHSPLKDHARCLNYPKVETTRQGIAPHLTGQTVTRVVVRERRLRWPVSPDLETVLGDQVINAVERRGKYLLLRTEHGSALLHLGMSGSLRLLPQQAPLRKHDHADIDLTSGYTLRLNDPRRFGALLWVPNPPESHPLLRALDRNRWVMISPPLISTSRPAIARRRSNYSS